MKISRVQLQHRVYARGVQPGTETSDRFEVSDGKSTPKCEIDPHASGVLVRCAAGSLVIPWANIAAITVVEEEAAKQRK